ncbi:MAG: tRNA pseudouridine(55) synthase TruB [Candidatus Rokubacteria bacterium]|nr:tRNA pseudouridine(55) synthase TruB [Candidatus Rokubacteria bacterium]
MMPSRSGVLVVDKGPGFTSFQVVAHLRRLLRAPKVGHGGTLDPQATGVLPILVNEATKLTPYLADHSKEYVATVRLGVVTDTQDLTGTVIRRAPVPALTPDAIREVLVRFVGETQQVPPMYSALHMGGTRLYELARKGLEVKREPRPVVVHALTLESVELPRFTVRVVCGRGTYVRTLCADLGEAIGCGAALERLVRTRVGPYSLEGALPWGEVERARDGAALWARLLPVDSAVGDFPAIRLTETAAAAVLNGQSVPVPEAAPMGRTLVRLYDSGGSFLGLGRLIPAHAVVKPERILHGDHPRPRVLPA